MTKEEIAKILQGRPEATPLAMEICDMIAKKELSFLQAEALLEYTKVLLMKYKIKAPSSYSEK